MQTVQRFLQAPPGRWGLEAGFFYFIFLLIGFCLRVQSDICGVGVFLALSFICMQSCQEESVIGFCSLDGAPQRSLLNNENPLFWYSVLVLSLKLCNSLGPVACQILLLQF